MNKLQKLKHICINWKNISFYYIYFPSSSTLYCQWYVRHDKNNHILLYNHQLSKNPRSMRSMESYFVVFWRRPWSNSTRTSQSCNGVL